MILDFLVAGVALWVLAATTPEKFEPGEEGEDTVQAAIVGGVFVKRPAGMPFAFVRVGPVNCCGVLIHKRAVLTAVHCTGTFNKFGFVFVGQKSNNWPSVKAQLAVLGSLLNPTRANLARYRAYMNKYTWVHDIQSIQVDPNFEKVGAGDDGNMVNDLALVILKQPSHLPVALLPHKPLASFLPGRMMFMFGFGMTGVPNKDEFDASSGYLKVAGLRYTTKRECSNFVKLNTSLYARASEHLEAINDSSMFCALMPKGTSGCFGDSGGPVTIMLPGGRHMVVGLVSSGAPACGLFTPGKTFNFFVDVSRYTRPIRRVLETLR